MRLQFKVQQYQTAPSTPWSTASRPARARRMSYRIDPARQRPQHRPCRADSGLRTRRSRSARRSCSRTSGPCSASRDLPLSAEARAEQQGRAPGAPNLDVEMETGTGKTYVYIKTIMELNKRYGWCEVHRRRAERRDPRGRGEVVRDHRRALPADVRHASPGRSSTTRRSCTSLSDSAPTPASR